MKKKPTQKKRSKPGQKVGDRIVRAWFDTVINPLVKALQKEQEHVVRRNWTWRYYVAGLEIFRPVVGHVDIEARDNLEQFLDFHADVRTKAAKHDQELAKLVQACLKVHSAVVASPQLRNLYEKFTSPEALKQLAEKNPTLQQLLQRTDFAESMIDRFFGAYSPSEHLQVLAEHIVNRSPDLPSYFTAAPFWNEHKESFCKILDEPDVKPAHDKLLEAAEGLSKAVTSLIVALKDIRLKLSLEHDVPYVEAPKQPEVQSRWG